MNVEKLDELLEELRKCDKEARAVDQMLTKPEMELNVLGSGGVFIKAGDIHDALLGRQRAIWDRRAELVAAVRAL